MELYSDFERLKIILALYVILL